MQYSTIITILFVVGMLITGTLNTVAAKIQNETPSLGNDGTVHKFHHPWVQTWLMFMGEILCLFYFGAQLCCCKKEDEDIKSKYNDFQEGPPPNPCSFIFILPTLMDLTGTTLGSIGLLYIPSSIWQMLRGARIVFSGIGCVIFLGRKLHLHHWLAMAIVCMGLTAVALSSFFSRGSDPAAATVTPQQIILGVCLTLGGQIFSAAQMVIEELFVRGKNYPSLNVVGMEGLFGFALTGLLLPGLYFIPDTNSIVSQVFAEDALDAMVQIYNSTILQVFCSLYICSIAFFNFFGLSLTKTLSAVHRTIFDTLRTVTVWGVNLFVFYALSLPQFGEAWSNWSYLQLGGFGFLIFGTLMYNEVFHIPCSVYDVPEKKGTPLASTLINEDDSSSEGAAA